MGLEVGPVDNGFGARAEVASEGRWLLGGLKSESRLVRVECRQPASVAARTNSSMAASGSSKRRCGEPRARLPSIRPAPPRRRRTPPESGGFRAAATHPDGVAKSPNPGDRPPGGKPWRGESATRSRGSGVGRGLAERHSVPPLLARGADQNRISGGPVSWDSLTGTPTVRGYPPRPTRPPWGVPDDHENPDWDPIGFSACPPPA